MWDSASYPRLKFSSYARLALAGTEVSTKSLSRIPFKRLVTALVLTQDVVVTCSYTAVSFNKARKADWLWLVNFASDPRPTRSQLYIPLGFGAVLCNSSHLVSSYPFDIPWRPWGNEDPARFPSSRCWVLTCTNRTRRKTSGRVGSIRTPFVTALLDRKTCIATNSLRGRLIC